MTHRLSWFKKALLPLVLSTATPAFAGGPPANQFIEFDVPGGTATTPVHINFLGEIAGSYTDANSVLNGFLRAPDGKFTTFHAPGAGTMAGQGTGVNGSNIEAATVGYFYDINFVVFAWIRSPDGKFTTYAVPGAGTGPGQGTEANNINAFGLITGDYEDGSNVAHGYVRAPDGTITEFDAPGAGTGDEQGTFNAGSTGLSLGGATTGWAIDANGVGHGYLRAADGRITVFDAPGAGTTSGLGTFGDSINDENEIVGWTYDANFVAHGFLRDCDGKVIVFDAPGAGTTPGNGVGTYALTNNDLGVIVGTYYDDGFGAHGFVRAADGSITTFDAPGAADTNGGVNNLEGMITGNFVDDVNYLTHGYLRK